MEGVGDSKGFDWLVDVKTVFDFVDAVFHFIFFFKLLE